MTTPEDKLAALLREQAETVVPAGDGLSKIQQRVAARRKARWLVVPGAALVTAAAVSAFFVFGTSDNSSLRQVTGPPSPTGYFCYEHMTEGPCPTPTPTASPSPDGFVGQPFAPAIWPFASHDQAEAWRQYPQGKPWAGDNLGVAQHFVDDYLKLTGVHLVQTCNSCDVVQILGADDQEIGTIGLVREDDGSPRAYSVAGVTFGSSFTVTSPTEGQKVTSPLQVKGTIVGVDENVAITLVTQDGRVIGSNGAPAGSGAPWSTTLTWTDSNWYTGALVLKTYSPRDGSLNRLIVLRVVRAT
jgi:hypothetical protein